MSTRSELARHFLELHRPGDPLLLPNPWDEGSARLFASLGFAALATTSSGAAAAAGRPDGGLGRAEALENARRIAAATPLPVSADLENGYSDDPEGVAETARGALAAGLAGFSVEDYTGEAGAPIYERRHAAERVAAAVEVAHAGEARLVVTARAENHIRGAGDLDDTIARLQAYQEAGADVLYAPALTREDDIAAVVSSVDRPVNVLALPGAPDARRLAELGVARISVGGAFAFAAYGAAAGAARELLDRGTYGYWERSGPGAQAMRTAFEETAG